MTDTAEPSAAASGALLGNRCASSTDAARAQRSSDPRVRRRLACQFGRRLQEHATRWIVVQAALAQHAWGAQQQLAHQLNLAPRTLRHWKRASRLGRLRPHLRGRRPRAIAPGERRAVLQLLVDQTGPAVGLCSLRAVFPRLRRAPLADLLRRYRRVWQARHEYLGYQLVWHRPGAVWAMDHTEAVYPVDGTSTYLLAVRDLASQRQLAWLPVIRERSEEVIQALAELFAEHGPPLVLKSDNGPAFRSEPTGELCVAEQLAQLFSPPGRPRYNGALERSNSTLKTYTDQQACCHGHPLRWTTEDVCAAQELANRLTHPWGPDGPSADEAWQARTPITEPERARFHQLLQVHRRKAAEDLGMDCTADLDHFHRSRWDRLALERTLQELGYLTKIPRRRKLSMPKRRALRCCGYRRRCTADEHRMRTGVALRASAANRHPDTCGAGGEGSEVALGDPGGRPAHAPKKSWLAQLFAPWLGGTMKAFGVRRRQRHATAVASAAPPLVRGEPVVTSWWKRCLYSTRFHSQCGKD